VRRPVIPYVLAMAVILGCALGQVPRIVSAQGHVESAPDANPIVVAQGFTPRSLAVSSGSSQAQVFVSAAEKPNRVFSIQAHSGLAALAGQGGAGSLGDGGPAADAELNLAPDSPVQHSGIAVGPDGSIFVADTQNSTIRRIAPASSTEPGIIRSIAGRWAPPQNVALVEPLGLAIDRGGDLFIADRGGNSVIELHAATGQLEPLAQVVGPASIAVTSDAAKIFVAAPDSGRVFAIDMKTRNVSVALDALDTGSSQQANAKLKGMPSGLAVDVGGNLFVAFANLDRVYRIDAKTGATLPIAASKFLHTPGDMAFDANGNLYLADQGHQRIVELMGLGVPASGVTLTPSPFNFGDEPTGGSTPVQQFTLTNNSGAPLNSLSIGFEGGNKTDFLNSGTSCSTSLSNAASCSINIAFTPTATGARSSNLTVMNSVAAQQAAVSGTGDDYELSLAPSQIQSLTVVAGNSVTFNLQATNDAVFMGLVTFECPGNLPAATFCTITPQTVNFTAPSQTIPFMVMLQTTSRTKVPGTQVPPLNEFPRGPQGPLPFPAAVGALLAVLICALLVRLRSRRRQALLFASALAVLATALVGCHHKGLTINGTPAGTTDLIVQGTAQNATRGVHFQLVVQ
jgi:DNA-binding beta-propeller fold protein YncE